MNIPGKPHSNTNTLHSILKARELKAKLKQKQSLTSPHSTQTQGWVAVLEEQEAKINFLFDRPLALLCFYSHGHHQSSAINPSQNDTFPSNQAFSVSLLLQLSLLAHFCQNKWQVRSVTLTAAKKLLHRKISFLVHLPQLVYVFALHPLVGFLKNARQRELSVSCKTLPSRNLLLHQSLLYILTMQDQSCFGCKGFSLCLQVAPTQLASCTNGSGIQQANRSSLQWAGAVTL